MDIVTGKIHKLTEEQARALNRHPSSNIVPICLEDATEKQKQEMCVSLHDHRSKLGKKLTKARCQNGSKRKKRRNKRR